MLFWAKAVIFFFFLQVVLKEVIILADQVKFKKGLSTNLDNVAVENGSILLTTDDNKLYIDNANTRIAVGGGGEMYAKLVDSGWIQFIGYTYSRNEVNSADSVLQTQGNRVSFTELTSAKTISQFDFDFIKLSCVDDPALLITLNKGGFCKLAKMTANYSTYSTYPIIELQLKQNGQLQIQSLGFFTNANVGSNGTFNFLEKHIYNIELYKYV